MARWSAVFVASAATATNAFVTPSSDRPSRFLAQDSGAVDESALDELQHVVPTPSLDCSMSASSVGIIGAAGLLLLNHRASARTPSTSSTASRQVTVTRRAFEAELGVQAPVGFWDPLGLAKDGDASAFKRRRASEIKHGRVCMLASIGYIVPEYFKWPGSISPASGLKFAEIPNGLGALAKIPSEGWLQIGLFIAHYEGFFWRQDAQRRPGDYAGYGFLGLGSNFIFSFPAVEIKDDAEKKKKLNVEIANGRLAMMAVIGMFYQDGLTGTPWGDWATYTSSPLRAFENELGVQAPVGFWDPLGLASAGTPDDFRRRRAAELKHGRISMLACIGYIVPEFFKWPGAISPATDLKFANIPNGLGALAKIPSEGWLQIGLFLGHYEAFFWRQDRNRAPGDYEGYGFLGTGSNFIFALPAVEIKDAAEKKKKLGAELANGRLAMMSIIGMFFQDGLTGKAWGDWFTYKESPLFPAKWISIFAYNVAIKS